MQLWQAAQKLGLENLLNFLCLNLHAACMQTSKRHLTCHGQEFWNVQENTPLLDSKVNNLAFVESCLKNARKQPTLRLKKVQSGIFWSLTQMCKKTPHLETQKSTIWHLLKPTSKLPEFTPLWDSKVYKLAFVEACLKCARIHPTLRPKSVQSGICWSIPQKCKNSPHFETQKYTIWHLLKPVSNVQEFTPLGNRKKWHVTLLLFLWHVNGSIKGSTNPSSFWQVCVQKNRMELNLI